MDRPSFSPSSDHTSVVQIVRHLRYSAMCMLIRNHRFIMPIAQGSFEAGFNNFTGIFDAQGFKVHVQGRFSQSVEFFNISNAEVAYSDVKDFVGSYSIVFGNPPSYVGVDTINVEFEGPGGKTLKVTGTIQGKLAQRYTITGSGTWSTRKED